MGGVLAKCCFSVFRFPYKIKFLGIIYAFNVTVPTSVSSTAASSNVQIRLHNVIYKMFDDLKEEINSKMPPKDEEQILG